MTESVASPISELSDRELAEQLATALGFKPWAPGDWCDAWIESSNQDRVVYVSSLVDGDGMLRVIDALVAREWIVQVSWSTSGLCTATCLNIGPTDGDCIAFDAINESAPRAVAEAALSALRSQP